VHKIGWRFALVLIVASIVLMLALMLFPDFAAWFKNARVWWRHARWIGSVAILAVCGALWLLSASLGLLTAWARGRLDAERVRKGQDVSVVDAPEDAKAEEPR